MNLMPLFTHKVYQLTSEEVIHPGPVAHSCTHVKMANEASEGVGGIFQTVSIHLVPEIDKMPKVCADPLKVIGELISSQKTFNIALKHTHTHTLTDFIHFDQFQKLE